MTEKELTTLVINKIDSAATFEAMKAANQINEDELYFIGGDGAGGVSGVKGSAEESYRTGQVSISKANIGLGNVDNTADTAKPISTAQQKALDGKVDKVTGKGLSTNDYTTAEKQNVANNTVARHSHSNKDVLDKITGIVTEDNIKNPAHFSDLVDYSGFQAGSQQIIRQIPNKTSQLTNDSGFATETYVNTKVAGVVNSAPETLDTLNELAEALGNDPNFATTMATELGKKVNAETGKGLSTNDLTATLKSHYDTAYTHSQTTHAPSNAEHNVIVGIQKNGTDISVNTSTRKVNITVPTKTSELTNDSSFIIGPFLTEDEVDTICGTAAVNTSNLTY